MDLVQIKNLNIEHRTVVRHTAPQAASSTGEQL